ncbi:MAG: hypothetical protein ACRD2E_04295 [Terriglobales bacterium]
MLQAARGSLKDVQAQLTRARLTTTLELDTQIIPAHQRAAVETRSALLANDAPFSLNPGSPFAHVQPNR